MEAFSEFLNALIDWFGIAMMVGLIVCLGGGFIQYITKIIKKQTKIKCLCHHEYEVKFIFDWDSKKEKRI